jgi:hypothetical protein
MVAGALCLARHRLEIDLRPTLRGAQQADPTAWRLARADVALLDRASRVMPALTYPSSTYRANMAACQRARAETRRIERLLDSAVSLDSAYREMNAPERHPTPQSTIESVLICVRERGLAALDEPANVQRLMTFDADADAQLNIRIAKFEADGLIPWKEK